MKLILKISWALTFFVHISKCSELSRPNIIFILTDDQDQMLGGSFPILNQATPMPKTLEILSKGGVTFVNAFVHTPICNPSRSETLTGRLFHNIKQTGAYNNDVLSMHVNESKVFNHSFVRSLKEDGNYTTGHFGKYLNIMPDFTPQGYDAWLANGGGDYIAPSFDTFGLSSIGIEDGSFIGTVNDYSTSVIGNATVKWIRSVVETDRSRPFLAYIAPKAAHEPFDPAPWYADHWDPNWPHTEPRDGGAWNASHAERADHPRDVARNPLLSNETADMISGIFKNRWRTLMSVDDLIADVIKECEALGVANNTYFIYSSDNGFQLGQFNMLMDKRRVYDWDTRVHLLISGPGVPKGVEMTLPVMNTDLAPTILELAGVQNPSNMAPFDGRSFASLLIPEKLEEETLPATRLMLQSYQPRDILLQSWRDTVFFEYYFVDDNIKCTRNCTVSYFYPFEDSWCTNLIDQPNEQCWCWGDDPNVCYQTESTINNFIALHKIDYLETLYVEYQNGSQVEQNIAFDQVDFHELYETSNDAWQLNNLYTEKSRNNPSYIKSLHEELRNWFHCSGLSCP